MIHFQVHEALGLSFKNTVELNTIIDTKLPARPQFTRREVVIGGEAFEMYSRDILECIRALWATPDFASSLAVEPERHYVDQDRTIRVIHEMHTGRWWWSTQVCDDMLVCSLNTKLSFRKLLNTQRRRRTSRSSQSLSRPTRHN